MARVRRPGSQAGGARVPQWGVDEVGNIRNSQEQSGTVRNSQEQSGTVRNSQEQ